MAYGAGISSNLTPGIGNQGAYATPSIGQFGIDCSIQFHTYSSGSGSGYGTSSNYANALAGYAQGMISGFFVFGGCQFND